MEDLVTLYDKYYKHITFDKNFVKELRRYRLNWSQKSDDYINFLSSGLTGVYPVRFSMIDEDNLYKLLRVNQKDLKRDSDRLRDIDPTRMVTSNSTYLSLIYLIHKFINIQDKKLTEEGIRELHFILSIKALGSMFYRFFSYNLDIATAKAVFERLNNKYIIKKEGSWQKYIEYRASDVLPNGIYYPRLIKLDTTDALDVISGVHSAYKSMLKNIFKVIQEVMADRSAISSTTVIESIEEGTMIRDDVDNPNLAVTYLLSIAPYKTDFADDDLLYLVNTLSKNVDISDIKATLNYISDKHDKKINGYLESVVRMSINYIKSKGIHNPTDDIIKTLNTLKGYWGSGDSDVRKLKDNLKILIYKSTGKKTSWVLSSAVITLLLYIYLRAIVKK